MKYTQYVNPFQGNGEIKPEKAEFPASTWNMIKGLSGNTHPGAVLPFGKYSCLSYDEAYPTGYGINALNWLPEPVEKLYDKNMFIGISHFHHSGTGGIKRYYNYAVTTPYYADMPELEPREIIEDTATPGAYSVKIDGISVDTTVSENIAIHKYHFEKEGGKIFVNFANNGLYNVWNARSEAEGKVTILNPSTALAEMKLSGIKFFFYFVIKGGEFDFFYKNGEKIDGNSASIEEITYGHFGPVFKVEKECEVRLATSCVSAEQAKEFFDLETRDFEEILSAARNKWEDFLSKVEIETDDSREMEIFYSNLYHTLIKPADFTNESFLLKESEGDYICDLATLWDVYKTQFPFLFTLYPEISKKIMKTFERFCEERGVFPHCILLSDNTNIEARQAKMLASHVIMDAYYRGIPADYEKLLTLIDKEGETLSECMSATTERATHTLDVCEGYTGLSFLADDLGKHDMAARYRENGKNVLNAFDESGMMRESDYYEGNKYNYSFRPLYDMESRVRIAGREKLEKEAMRFFGFIDSEDLESRFESFNNETDMETPYFLHFIGRRDLMCRVLKTGLDSMFTTGTGGIPGNADSGGLTACYIWSALGIFPMPCFNKMIVGLPRYKKAVLHMPNADFTIIREGEGEETDKAYFNGVLLENFELAVTDMIKGGTLKVVMK